MKHDNRCHVICVSLENQRRFSNETRMEKARKTIYGAKAVPALVLIPAQNYIMIDGKGNPNDADFSHRVSALFSLAYTIKMNYKAAVKNGDLKTEIDDFAVYPLEGIWRLPQGGEFRKEHLRYTLMICQPEWISGKMVITALEQVKRKKPSPLWEKVYFARKQNGECIECLHIGAFDDEPASFEKMKQFASENHLQWNQEQHREIYLNNVNRTAKEKWKTILRYSVG